MNAINLLNEGFSGKLTQAGTDCDGNEVSGLDMSIQFVLENIDRTVDDEWFSLYYEDEESLQSIGNALYDGNCSTLNVYTTDITEESGEDTPVQGIAVPSDACAFLPTVLRIWEFTFIDYSLIPRSQCDDPGKVDTLIHEVGHWIGLYHPFEGGCSGTDFVEDTPQQTVVNTVCPIGSDTCPDQEGLDSIHNYMSYTGECCTYTFTEGQKLRSHSFLSIFRSLGLVNASNTTKTLDIDEEEIAPTCIETFKLKVQNFQCFIERLKVIFWIPL